MNQGRKTRWESSAEPLSGGNCDTLTEVSLGSVSAELAREMLEWAPLACFLCDPDTHVVQANQAAETLTGWSRDRLLGLSLAEIFPAPLADCSSVTRGKLQIVPDGRQVWVDVEYHELPDGRRAVFMHDRTRLRETETSLFNSRRKYRELFERTGDAILIIENGQFRDCNEATVRLLRYGGKAELLNTHPSQLSPPHQPDGRASYEKAEEMMRIAMERGSHRFEWEHKRADGEVFPVEVLLTAVSVEEDRQILHTVWRDITDRKLAEEKLLQAQKLDSIGLLAGGVAHDFNNMLSGIMGHASLLLDMEQDPDRSSSLSEILRAAEHSADLTRKLLAFGRRGKYLVAAVGLNLIVDEVTELLAHSFDKKIEFAFRLDPGLHNVDADPGQMHQVVMNLCVNACQAMPRGGTLTVTSTNLKIPAEGDPAWPELRLGNFVELTVRDDGVGMTEDVRLRAFEPFFSTREDGDVKGTGLGLSTVYGIVQNHGGGVHISSQPNAGTTVTVRLPRGSREAAPVPERHRPAQQGSEFILVVDDEEIVRRMAERMLVKLGHTVIVAKDGREAVAIFRERNREISGILLDLKMPHMDGRETLAKLQEIDPVVRALLSTGYGLNEESQVVLDEGARGLIAKPYRLEDLSEAVRSMLT